MPLFKRQPKQMALPGMDVSRSRPKKPGLVERVRGSLTNTPVTRRRFLEGTLGWVTVAIASAVGIPAAIAWISPAFRTSEEGWAPVGSVVEPTEDGPDLTTVGTPVLASFTQLVEDAYLAARPQEIAIFVTNHGDGKYSVYDAKCTHLGCPFEWDEDSGSFFCPCHNGVFDKEGRVTGGPPPRPLDRYEYKVEADILYVGKLYEVNDELERVTQ